MFHSHPGCFLSPLPFVCSYRGSHWLGSALQAWCSPLDSTVLASSCWCHQRTACTWPSREKRHGTGANGQGTVGCVSERARGITRTRGKAPWRKNMEIKMAPWRFLWSWFFTSTLFWPRQLYNGTEFLMSYSVSSLISEEEHSWLYAGSQKEKRRVLQELKYGSQEKSVFKIQVLSHTLSCCMCRNTSIHLPLNLGRTPLYSV